MYEPIKSSDKKECPYCGTEKIILQGEIGSGTDMRNWDERYTCENEKCGKNFYIKKLKKLKI